MVMYSRIRWAFRTAQARARVARNLGRLVKQLDDDLPDKDADDHLLLATWNIRDFAKAKDAWGYGKRKPESFFYIAEIISRFDFVAVQEVNELDEWEQVMSILGGNWDFIASDVTDPKLGGNGERLLFVYDKRKVSFKGIAGEIVLPNRMLVRADSDASERDLHAGKQFRRTPFLARFQAGWFKFDICTVHIYYGEDGGEKLQERIAEIDRVASYFGKRAKRELRDGRSLILLGDFNIKHPEHETMKSLLDAGFEVPDALRRPTNLNKKMYYDQIAFMTKRGIVDFVDQDPGSGLGNAGVFEMFKSIYRARDFAEYRDQVVSSKNGKKVASDDTKLKKVYKSWKTWQLSDHKPLWVRVRSNDAERYLKQIVDDGGRNRT